MNKNNNIAAGNKASAIYRVLLVEDIDEMRAALVQSIDANPDLCTVASCSDIAEALLALNDCQCDAQRIDVLVTDLGLPDGSGTEIIRAAREQHPHIEIMVISVFGDERNVIAALEAGASGYLLKDTGDSEISESILQLIAGHSPISPAIARHLIRRFNATPRPKESTPAADAPQLTAREQQVLNYTARGFSYQEIADMLEISPHTIATYTKHIYRKLEVRSRSEAVYEAVNLGLVDLR